MSAILKTARKDFNRIHAREWLLKVDSFSVVLHDSRKHDHFILYTNNIFKMETLDAWAQSPDPKAKLATASMAQPKCFSKKGWGHFKVCSVQTCVTRARKQKQLLD